MSIFDKFKSFSFDRNKSRLFGIKSGIIWGYFKDKNSVSPILYISKPKHISQEEFDELLDSIEINFVKK